MPCMVCALHMHMAIYVHHMVAYIGVHDMHYIYYIAQPRRIHI